MANIGDTFTDDDGRWRVTAARNGVITGCVLVEPSAEFEAKRPTLPPPIDLDAPDIAILTALPDPSLWTNAQLKEGVVRLLRLELRRRGLLA
jgi:hypothetical protein